MNLKQIFKKTSLVTTNLQDRGKTGPTTPERQNLENKNCGNDTGQAIQFLQKNKLQGNIKEKEKEPTDYRESLTVMCRPNLDPNSNKNYERK